MNLYTEKSTRLIYEARLFDEFVMVRPVSPGFETLVKRMDHLGFEKEFEEFAGNHAQVLEFISGMEEIPEFERDKDD